MSRQESKARMGFYPAHPRAIDLICDLIRTPEAGTTGIQILDPCAGEGLAIRQIADRLAIPYGQVYAVELDPGRAAKVAENVPGVVMIEEGSSSFFNTKITPGSFGLVYCNPPFDDELGGGKREELSFCYRASWCLCAGGTLALVLPESQLCGKPRMVEHLDAYFADITVARFPDDYRPFREVVVLGRKRKTVLSDEKAREVGRLSRMQMQWRTYNWEFRLPRLGDDTDWDMEGGVRNREIPWTKYDLKPCWRPHKFEKSGYTAEELAEVVARSPLAEAVLSDSRTEKSRQPPMPPGMEHVAMLLASGKLDGVVDCPEEPSHVVRGTSKKVWYENKAASRSSENPETGAVKTVDVMSQKPILIIRKADRDGVITTFGDETPEEIEAVVDETEVEEDENS